MKITLTVCTALTLIIVSCRTIQKNQEQVEQGSTTSGTPSAESWISSTIKAIPGDFFNFTNESALSVLFPKSPDEPSTTGAAQEATIEATPPVVAELMSSSCDQGVPARVQKWRVRFSSIFGVHPVEFSLSENSTSVLIDDRKLEFSQFPRLESKELLSFCDHLQKQGVQSPAIASAELMKTIKSWLAMAASDCEFEAHPKKAWQCKFETIEPTLAISELDGIHKVMVTRWNRQPYLLSRRLALTRSLAQALASNTRATKLDTYCRVVSYSMPSELPLALASLTWQELVCKAPSEHRFKVAELGLTKALAEIDFLRSQFDQNSKLGVLAIRIPKAEVPARDLWISLQPIAPTSTKETGHSGCWHPLFAKAEKSLKIARSLDLLNEAPGGSCDRGVGFGNQIPEPMVASPERYMSASITSETEFVITNGQSKLLRLPVGAYSYVVRPHSEALDELETDPNISPSMGTIEWNKQKPNVLINHW